MRKAFGMIQVLFFMVILSTILTITMKYASITVKQTSSLYAKEQAELFMNSSIELALLGISSHKHQNETSLLKYIHVISDDKRFEANITVNKYYLFSNNSVQTEESTGMIDMNIVVETNNTHPKNNQPIKLQRRSLQRL